jgi:hypothetical protein
MTAIYGSIIIAVGIRAFKPELDLAPHCHQLCLTEKDITSFLLLPPQAGDGIIDPAVMMAGDGHGLF